jgi:hypothetical protein
MHRHSLAGGEERVNFSGKSGSHVSCQYTKWWGNIIGSPACPCWRLRRVWYSHSATFMWCVANRWAFILLNDTRVTGLPMLAMQLAGCRWSATGFTQQAWRSNLSRSVFARSNTAIVGWNPTEAWMFVFVLCAFFLFLHSLKWDSQPT